MHSLSEEQEKQVLGELLADKLQAILEYVSEIPSIKEDIKTIKSDLKNLSEKVDGYGVDIRYLQKAVFKPSS